MGARELIGAPVEKQLDATLWKLLLAEIGLHDLTPGLRGFYSMGFVHGQDSMRPAVEQAESDRDRYFERWHHGSDLPDIRLRRMRAAAEEYWNELLEAQL